MYNGNVPFSAKLFEALYFANCDAFLPLSLTSLTQSVLQLDSSRMPRLVGLEMAAQEESTTTRLTEGLDTNQKRK